MSTSQFKILSQEEIDKLPAEQKEVYKITLLHTWYKADEDLKALKSVETDLRTQVYRLFFVSKDEHGVDILPKEGTNTHALPDAWVLKAQRVINRSVDQATYKMLKAEREELRARAGGEGEELSNEDVVRLALLDTIPLDDLVRYKPELETREYRKLTEEQLKIFDTALVIKDGTPQVEIVLPKRRA